LSAAAGEKNKQKRRVGTFLPAQQIPENVGPAGLSLSSSFQKSGQLLQVLPEPILRILNLKLERQRPVFAPM
jgi:hypothetical protein